MMQTVASSALLANRNSMELIQTALGVEKADRVIINARLVNVYTGEIQNNTAVGIKGEWIAGVGECVQDMIGKQTIVMDADGKTLIPGFIEWHTHLASMISPAAFLPFAMKSGTTTIITETMDTYAVAGYDGVMEFMDSLSNQPIKVWFTAPAMASISKKTRGLPRTDLKRLLGQDRVIGLGESYWQAVIQEPEQFLPLFQDTLLAGKRLEGHSAGVNAKKLAAYAAAGISSCHEPTTAEEVAARLRQGLYVMIREGSIRRDLQDISRIRGMGVSLRRLILTSDGVSPSDLIEKGYLEFIVQKAIACGFDPVTAVQMATLNVAEHFGLDHLIGGIAPGRQADMVLIPEPDVIEPETVISRGQVIVENQRLKIQPRSYKWSYASRNSIHLTEQIKPDDFIVNIKTAVKAVTIRVIDQITDLVTQELHLPMPVTEGQLIPDVHQDIIKVAAIDRTHMGGNTCVGFIRGFGLKSGAFACSAAWDTSDIIVVGVTDADMAAAVNHIQQIQGGAVVCSGQKILAEVPVPVMGIMSLSTASDMADCQEHIRK
ncbi:MAG TPA: adenine deaminase C-terminal domain-containing protein, partial [Desulfatirhabdiaceae bacterium]|nr:adenine deaminase C-terminal domain-containing protein [Desulfatirhabdiaceae bacterium]